MSSNDEVSDDHTIQIISPQDHTPNQNHEQTPVATSTNPPTPRHESRGVNQMTPEELSSLKEDLTRYIRRNDHGGLELKLIIDKCADIVRIPLNDRGDTALHVAASEWLGLGTVEELVQHMSPEDMLIRNLYGALPVHLAVLYGRNQIVQILLAQEVLDKMDSEDIKRLFLMTIRVDMFDCAMQLFEKYPTDLAIARNEEQLTALHMLARKPPKSLGGNKESKADELLKKLWIEVNQLEHNTITELITHPSPVLFDAIKSGNDEAALILIDKNRELLTIKDPENGRNLLHLVVLLRQEKMFRRIFRYEDPIMAVEVDNQGNNILHFAAHLPVEFQELSSLRASIQMQRELQWFQFVAGKVPHELRTMRNKMGKRPIDVFYEEHKKLSEEIKDAGKGIAESGMLVAALVATVAFTAALSNVPGDETNAWFVVFILANAFALCNSSSSILLFLSNFASSRFAQSEFVRSIHPSLILGRLFLFFSVFAMIVAFTAASFLIFDHKSKWVAYVVTYLAVSGPLSLYLMFQSNRLDDLVWSKYCRLSNLDIHVDNVVFERVRLPMYS